MTMPLVSACRVRPCVRGGEGRANARDEIRSTKYERCPGKQWPPGAPFVFRTSYFVPLPLRRRPQPGEQRPQRVDHAVVPLAQQCGQDVLADPLAPQVV